MKALQLFFLVLLVSCNNNPNKVTQHSIKVENEKQATVLPKVDNDDSKVHGNEKVEGALGILTTSDDYQFGDTIRVYQPNGKLLTVLKNSEEYQVIALRCLALTSQYYQVLLEDGRKGLVSRQSKHIKFQTWEEHILSLFSVEFDNQKNPLMKEPDPNSGETNYDKDEFYHPNRIIHEWLQVKWGDENKWNYGWIKWKNKGKLIIKFYYFA